jgi:hypothetical protein
VTIERQTSRISDERLVELFTLGELYMSDFIYLLKQHPLEVDVRTTCRYDGKGRFGAVKELAGI